MSFIIAMLFICCSSESNADSIDQTTIDTLTKLGYLYTGSTEEANWRDNPVELVLRQKQARRAKGMSFDKVVTDNELFEWTIAQHTTQELSRGALMNYQALNNINVTGRLDEVTKRTMRQPRLCNVPETDTFLALTAKGGNGAKRTYYNLGTVPVDTRYGTMTRLVSKHGTWPYTDYTYDIHPSAEPFLSQDIVQRAFDQWQDSLKIVTFTRNRTNPDIYLRWEANDNPFYTFDGPGGTLGHAYFPYNNSGDGEIHIDAEETSWVDVNWRNVTDNDRFTKLDLESVLAHEIGHSLGLAHLPVSNALMWPMYSWKKKVTQFDTRIARNLFAGVNDQVPTSVPATTPTSTSASANATLNSDIRCAQNIPVTYAFSTPTDNVLHIVKGGVYFRVSSYYKSSPYIHTFETMFEVAYNYSRDNKDTIVGITSDGHDIWLWTAKHMLFSYEYNPLAMAYRYKNQTDYRNIFTFRDPVAATAIVVQKVIFHSGENIFVSTNHMSFSAHSSHINSYFSGTSVGPVTVLWKVLPIRFKPCTHIFTAYGALTGMCGNPDNLSFFTHNNLFPYTNTDRPVLPQLGNARNLTTWALNCHMGQYNFYSTEGPTTAAPTTRPVVYPTIMQLTYSRLVSKKPRQRNNFHMPLRNVDRDNPNYLLPMPASVMCNRAFRIDAVIYFNGTFYIVKHQVYMWAYDLKTRSLSSVAAVKTRALFTLWEMQPYKVQDVIGGFQFSDALYVFTDDMVLYTMPDVSLKPYVTLRYLRWNFNLYDNTRNQSEGSYRSVIYNSTTNKLRIVTPSNHYVVSALSLHPLYSSHVNYPVYVHVGYKVTGNKYFVDQLTDTLYALDGNGDTFYKYASDINDAYQAPVVQYTGSVHNDWLGCMTATDPEPTEPTTEHTEPTTEPTTVTESTTTQSTHKPKVHKHNRTFNALYPKGHTVGILDTLLVKNTTRVHDISSIQKSVCAADSSDVIIFEVDLKVYIMKGRYLFMEDRLGEAIHAYTIEHKLYPDPSDETILTMFSVPHKTDVLFIVTSKHLWAFDKLTVTHLIAGYPKPWSYFNVSTTTVSHAIYYQPTTALMVWSKKADSRLSVIVVLDGDKFNAVKKKVPVVFKLYESIMFLPHLATFGGISGGYMYMIKTIVPNADPLGQLRPVTRHHEKTYVLSLKELMLCTWAENTPPVGFSLNVVWTCPYRQHTAVLVMFSTEDELFVIDLDYRLFVVTGSKYRRQIPNYAYDASAIKQIQHAIRYGFVTQTDVRLLTCTHMYILDRSTLDVMGNVRLSALGLDFSLLSALSVNGKMYLGDHSNGWYETDLSCFSLTSANAVVTCNLRTAYADRYPMIHQEEKLVFWQGLYWAYTTFYTRSNTDMHLNEFDYSLTEEVFFPRSQRRRISTTITTASSTTIAPITAATAGPATTAAVGGSVTTDVGPATTAAVGGSVTTDVGPATTVAGPTTTVAVGVTTDVGPATTVAGPTTTVAVGVTTGAGPTTTDAVGVTAAGDSATTAVIDKHVNTWVLKQKRIDNTRKTTCLKITDVALMVARDNYIDIYMNKGPMYTYDLSLNTVDDVSDHTVSINVLSRFTFNGLLYTVTSDSISTHNETVNWSDYNIAVEYAYFVEPVLHVRTSTQHVHVRIQPFSDMTLSVARSNVREGYVMHKYVYSQHTKELYQYGANSEYFYTLYRDEYHVSEYSTFLGSILQCPNFNNAFKHSMVHVHSDGMLLNMDTWPSAVTEPSVKCAQDVPLFMFEANSFFYIVKNHTIVYLYNPAMHKILPNVALVDSAVFTGALTAYLKTSVLHVVNGTHIVKRWYSDFELLDTVALADYGVFKLVTSAFYYKAFDVLTVMTADGTAYELLHDQKAVLKTYSIGDATRNLYKYAHFKGSAVRYTNSELVTVLSTYNVTAPNVKAVHEFDIGSVFLGCKNVSRQMKDLGELVRAVADSDIQYQCTVPDNVYAFTYSLNDYWYMFYNKGGLVVTQARTPELSTYIEYYTYPNMMRAVQYASKRDAVIGMYNAADKIIIVGQRSLWITNGLSIQPVQYRWYNNIPERKMTHAVYDAESSLLVVLAHANVYTVSIPSMVVVYVHTTAPIKGVGLFLDKGSLYYMRHNMLYEAQLSDVIRNGSANSTARSLVSALERAVFKNVGPIEELWFKCANVRLYERYTFWQPWKNPTIDVQQKTYLQPKVMNVLLGTGLKRIRAYNCNVTVSTLFSHKYLYVISGKHMWAYNPIMSKLVDESARVLEDDGLLSTALLVYYDLNRQLVVTVNGTGLYYLDNDFKRTSPELHLSWTTAFGRNVKHAVYYPQADEVLLFTGTTWFTMNPNTRAIEYVSQDMTVYLPNHIHKGYKLIYLYHLQSPAAYNSTTCDVYDLKVKTALIDGVNMESWFDCTPDTHTSRWVDYVTDADIVTTPTVLVKRVATATEDRPVLNRTVFCQRQIDYCLAVIEEIALTLNETKGPARSETYDNYKRDTLLKVNIAKLSLLELNNTDAICGVKSIIEQLTQLPVQDVYVSVIAYLRKINMLGTIIGAITTPFIQTPAGIAIICICVLLVLLMIFMCWYRFQGQDQKYQLYDYAPTPRAESNEYEIDDRSV